MKSPIAWPDLPDSRRPKGGITLHELGEVIRRLGMHRGFDPVTEHRAGVPGNPRLRIDWVWLQKEGVPFAAFEIEGSDVLAHGDSVQMDIKKLNSLGARYGLGVRQKLIVTYNTRYKASGWSTLRRSDNDLRLAAEAAGVSVVSGEDLRTWLF